MALINTIYEAIDQRRMLSLVYKGETRTVEPYIVGYTDKNKLLLSAVQRSGGSGSGFRSFDVEDIRSYEDRSPLLGNASRLQSARSALRACPEAGLIRRV